MSSRLDTARLMLAAIYGAAFVSTLTDYQVAQLVVSALRHTPGPACNYPGPHNDKDHRHA